MTISSTEPAIYYLKVYYYRAEIHLHHTHLMIRWDIHSRVTGCGADSTDYTVTGSSGRTSRARVRVAATISVDNNLPFVRGFVW